MSSKFHKIKEFKLLPEYRLWLNFDDGINGEVDLSSKVGKGVFKFWEDFTNFSTVELNQDGRSLHWNNDIDLCADSLYLKIINSSATEIFGT